MYKINCKRLVKCYISNLPQLFITMTSSYSYFMTSFSTADLGLKGDQNSLDRGIKCKTNEMSRNWHDRNRKFVSGITTWKKMRSYAKFNKYPLFITSISRVSLCCFLIKNPYPDILFPNNIMFIYKYQNYFTSL